jgi:hypothetical protein
MSHKNVRMEWKLSDKQFLTNHIWSTMLMINNNSSRGRGIVARTLAAFPRWIATLIHWISHVLPGGPPVELWSRCSSSLTSSKASSPKVPRVSTAKGQNMYWFWANWSKNPSSSAQIWRPPPQQREKLRGCRSYKWYRHRRTLHPKPFPLDHGRKVRPPALLPSVRNSPGGSSWVEIFTFEQACLMISLRAEWRERFFLSWQRPDRAA